MSERKKRRCSLNIRNIPEDLKARFKAQCDLQGVTLHDAILSFMYRVSVRELTPGKDKRHAAQQKRDQIERSQACGLKMFSDDTTSPS